MPDKFMEKAALTLVLSSFLLLLFITYYYCFLGIETGARLLGLARSIY